MVTGSRFELVSPLNRDEVVRVLNDSIDGNWRFFGNRPVVGSVDRSGFSLRMRIGYRNSFQTILRGTLVDANGSTRLRCTAGMSLYVTIFMFFWFSALIAFAVPMVGFALQGDDWQGLAIVSGMLAFGAGLVWIGRRMARGERDRLLAFVADTIDAEPA
jgi:hypothetical protein